MFKFHDIQQNSHEWFDLRIGKLGSSSCAKIMANFGKSFGEPAKKLAYKLALERVTGKKDETESFTNQWMERGHELEPVARELYEIQEFTEVKNGGYFCNDKLGDSPDGIVGENGRIEIKCVSQYSHWPLIKKGGYDLAYKWQIQWHLMFGAEWCDFISYCPEFPESKQLYVYTVKKDHVMQSQMQQRLIQFEDLIEENIKHLE